jgi:hypothetical protein
MCQVEARPTRADELPHLADASGAAWYETWTFELASDGGALGAHLGLTLRPSDGVTWFWACVVGRDRPLVAVIDHDVPVPRRDLIELRASGLWVDVEIETPGEHVSVGMEAFGLAFESPSDALGSPRGRRIPVGFDLEWELAGDVHGDVSGAYRLPCSVIGEVLVGEEQLVIDGRGARSHCWGRDPWWAHHKSSLSAWVGGRYVLEGGAVEPDSPLVPVTVGGREAPLDIDAVAFAPIAITPPDRAAAVLHAALVTVSDRDRRGAGWIHRSCPAR